jgi:hypothetical protein
MVKHTSVFRKVADKLLDAFLPNGVLKIGCRCSYLLRSHLAIMIPANKFNMASAFADETCARSYRKMRINFPFSTGGRHMSAIILRLACLLDKVMPQVFHLYLAI